MRDDCINTHENDLEKIKKYRSKQLIDNLMTNLYSYYKHDILKLSILAGNISLFIEEMDSNEYPVLSDYCKNIFKKRFSLILKHNKQEYTYTPHDIIYTVRSISHHAGDIRKDKIKHLWDFMLGVKYDVILWQVFGQLTFYSEENNKHQYFERERQELNHHRLPPRDCIVLTIIYEILNILNNKSALSIGMDFPRDGQPIINKNTIQNLAKYYPNFEESYKKNFLFRSP